MRALHRIYSDIKEVKLGNLGKNRKDKIRLFLQILVANLERLETKKIKQLLELHSEVQPWHKNLPLGIKPTINRIESYYSDSKRQIVEKNSPEKIKGKNSRSKYFIETFK